METTLNNLTTFTSPPTNPRPLLLHHHFHSSPLLHRHHHHHHPSLPSPPPPPPRSITTTTKSSTSLTPISPKSPKYPSSSPHLRPSSGYAAAILDMAMRDGTLDAVIKDMGRLGRVMRRRDIRDLMVMECGGVVEGEVVKGVMRAMGVGRVVKGLVDLVVEKGRGEVLGEIVVEFERILDELTGMMRRRRRGLKS